MCAINGVGYDRWERMVGFDLLFHLRSAWQYLQHYRHRWYNVVSESATTEHSAPVETLWELCARRTTLFVIRKSHLQFNLSATEHYVSAD